MNTVIFDLDRTLTRKDTYLPFLFCCSRKFGLRMKAAFLIPIFSILYCLKVVTNSRLKQAFLWGVLGGIAVDRLKPVVDQYVAKLIDRGLNRPLLQTLRDHLKRGDRVILATASFDLYVERLAENLGIQQVVCTRAEICSGVITGRILGENCHGAQKLQRLEALLAPSDWQFAILYTDHHSDLPLLQKVSRGYLVNPDSKTRSLLKRHGFPAFHAH
jgi:HAD superfamily hydrolase (TIGR01490 family)